MKINLNKIINKKVIAVFLVILFSFIVANFVFAASAGTANPTAGGLSTEQVLGTPTRDGVKVETTTLGAISGAIVKFLGWFFYFLAYVIGLLLTLLIKVLVDVAGYSNFINAPAVEQGWIIVRDLCNMFFILILLVIAFATILRVESYQWKKTLPKLIIMAVLINFSRTICGLIIDFAQVIMLTFVNGFGANAENNLVDTFNIRQYLAFSGDTPETEVGTWETAGAILAGFFAIVITFIVVLVLLLVLIFRIIMLWVYTILSPIAFLASAFPQGQKYASQWWSEFSKNVIVGPVLAFFIWLALTTAHQSSDFLNKTNINVENGKGYVEYGSTKAQICGTQNELFCGTNFQTYLITIALLIGGLIVTQQVGGVAGSIAGKGMAAIQKGRGIMTRGALAPFKGGLVGSKALASFG
ncbi:MAG: hypothetical protein ABIG60_00930, partial [Patescibacteria group bacterium]